MSDQFDAKAFLKTVTSQPGVYRMYDAGGTVIYVGKAKDLKKRLSSYFRSNLASRKTEALVAQIQQIDVTVTHTETEALLLEHNYIKLYQPRYNVLLRDDKSYPFIFLSGDTHPRLAMHRGAKHAKGEYFGPFPNGYAVRETLALLQKIFPIRQCENSVYRNRSRPCLQYQIGFPAPVTESARIWDKVSAPFLFEGGIEVFIVIGIYFIENIQALSGFPVSFRPLEHRVIAKCA